MTKTYVEYRSSDMSATKIKDTMTKMNVASSSDFVSLVT